jgi:hypothetical protein
LDILTKLLDLSLESQPAFQVSFSSKLPSPAHVFRDLYEQHTHNRSEFRHYRNQLLDRDDEDTTFADFAAGWVALADKMNADVKDPSQTPYSVSNVLASPSGIAGCGLKLPSFLSHSNVCVRPLDFNNVNGPPHITTTISPAGSITDPHIDGSGSGAALCQLFGTKLVLTWPASSENLKWMEDRHGIKEGPLKLLSALDEMSDMRVTTLFASQCMILDPGAIHAVLSLDNSAISSCDFVDATWLESDNVERQMLWEAELVNKQRKGLLKPNLYDIWGYLEQDLNMWSTLALKSGDPGNRIKALIESVKSKILDV